VVGCVAHRTEFGPEGFGGAVHAAERLLQSRLRRRCALPPRQRLAPARRQLLAPRRSFGAGVGQVSLGCRGFSVALCERRLPHINPPDTKEQP
jgi:hypothetical protein